MTTRETVTIKTPDDRARIARWAQKVEAGTVVTFRKKSRSTEQSAKMWAMLGEVSKQVEWHGQYLPAEDWKDMFTASLRHARFVPGIDKGTFVPLGMRTSTMTIEEMSNLIELIHAFGAERGVVFKNSDEDTPSTSTEEAGEPAPHSPASTPSDVHWDWMRNIARMLVAATNYGGEIGLLKNQKAAALASYEKPADCPEIIAGKAQAVFGYCVQIVKQELEPEDGLAIIAAVCGCEPDDLTGRA